MVDLDNKFKETDKNIMGFFCFFFLFLENLFTFVLFVKSSKALVRAFELQKKLSGRSHNRFKITGREKQLNNNQKKKTVTNI